MYSAAIDIRAAAADDSIIELERKRRAPEDLEDVEELPEDQLAVEARTVDDMSVGEAKTQKKLGHFRVRPYLHHPFHVKPAERYYFLLSNRKKKVIHIPIWFIPFQCRYVSQTIYFIIHSKTAI